MIQRKMAEAVLVEEGEGYDVEFIDENVPKDKITCSVCLYTLREPMQAVPCGHRFCKTCIEKVEHQQQENGQRSLNCPNDRMQIQIFPDIGRKREILDFHVKCTNIPNECDWKGELRYYDDHLEKCLFQLLMCTKNCGKGGIWRKEMKHHLECDCPNNLQECKYSIIGCTFKGHLNVMDQHSKENLDEHIFLQTTNQIHEIFDLKENFQLSRKTSKASEAEINVLNQKIHHLENEDRKKDEKVRQLERKTQNQDEVIEQYKQNISELQNKFSELGNFFQPRCPYTFTVKKVPEHFTYGECTYIVSEEFYFLNGYRGKLKISFNYGEFNNNVFIGLKIIKGPFDDYLEWPMLFGKVTLTIFVNGKCWFQDSFIFKDTEKHLKDFYNRPDGNGDESKRRSWGFSKQREKSFASDEIEFFVNVERV